jgi:hypothetical protein
VWVYNRWWAFFKSFYIQSKIFTSGLLSVAKTDSSKCG